MAGPTAVGKTKLAISVARGLKTAVISADSRQCYRELNIGTAKPTEAQLAVVPHFFINSHSLKHAVSAADFERYALAKCDALFQTSDCVVVCGGTGLYIQALCDGLDEMPQVDPTLSQEVKDAYASLGISWLQEEVKRLDPEFYAVGETQNPARLMRALAFFRETGQSIISYRTAAKKPRPFRLVKVALSMPRALLYQRINERVDEMMDNGLLEEVKSLIASGWIAKGANKVLLTVGYRELIDHLEHRLTLDAAVDKIKQHTRNYAKRQLTWFRRDHEFTWFNAQSCLLEKEVFSFIEEKMKVGAH